MVLGLWRDARFRILLNNVLSCLGMVLAVVQMRAASVEPHFEAVEIPGKMLAGNPLLDPVERRAAVFTPRFQGNSSKFITVYYLPGYGGCSEDFLGSKGTRFAEMRRRCS